MIYLNLGEKRCRPVVVLFSMVLLLAGCNTQMPKPDAANKKFSSLGDASSRLVFGTSFPVGSAEEAILLGDAALARGENDRALFEYLRALELDGSNADVLFKIGKIHLARGDNRRAKMAFELALASKRDHAGALMELGILRIHRRDYAGAQAYLSQAVVIAPGAARAHDALGVVADIQGDYTQAQQHYGQAIALAGNVPYFLNNLGYSRYLSGDMVGAEQAFNAALRANPNYKRAWRNLALIRAKAARYEEALEAFGKTEEIYEAYNDVGYLAMVAGRFDDADRFFQEAMRLSPSYYELADRNAKRLIVLRGVERAGQ